MGGIFGNSDDDDDDPRIVDWERFETSVRSFLELLFSPEWNRYCSKKTFTIEGERICPDLAIFADGTNLCVCVAEAKNVRDLEPRDVEQVARYKRLLAAETAFVFVPAPPRCTVHESANDCAIRNGIQIESL